ncbi:hypothetical protein, partial [Aeromonas lacus]|uniref:hypothetical protein n=1 Tax=Aeromonas lacus TaxID=558884 RepID=UPI0013768013
KYGFSAKRPEDGNDDPLELAVGTPSALQNSRLISTSEIPGGYVNRFTGMLINSGISEAYLYRVRATDNVYSMVDYLNNLRQIGFMTDDPRVPLATSLLSRYRSEREWFAVDRIEAFQVAGAQRLRVDLSYGDVTVDEEERNPFFTDDNTHASAFPFAVVNNPVPDRLSFIQAMNGPTPSGALMGPPSPPSSGTFSSLFSCLPSGSGSSPSGRSSTNKDLKCEANVTMRLGEYYGLIENINDIL